MGGRAQCCQISTRQALAPQMCSDHLSSEFQRLADQRTGTEFGDPRALLRQHKVDSAWVLLFNAGERNEGVCARARGPSHAHPRVTQAGSQRALGWPRQVHSAGP